MKKHNLQINSIMNIIDSEMTLRKLKNKSAYKRRKQDKNISEKLEKMQRIEIKCTFKEIKIWKKRKCLQYNQKAVAKMLVVNNSILLQENTTMKKIN